MGPIPVFGMQYRVSDFGLWIFGSLGFWDFGILGFWVQIMGLNPPFGVHGSKASQFVLRATEFCPRLLILIVPPETKP